MHTKDVSDVLFVYFVQNGLDVALRVGDTLCTDHSLENLIGLRLTQIVDDTWTVDQIDALRERDVLPDFGLTRDWGHLTAGLFHEGVDDGRLAHVRVADHTHADVLLLFM